MNTGNAQMMDAPRRRTEMEEAISACRDRMDHLELMIGQIAQALEPVLPSGYLQQVSDGQPEEQIPAGSMRAMEIFALSRRVEKAAGKLSALAQSVEV